MAGWDFTNVGIDADFSEIRQIRRLLDYLGYGKEACCNEYRNYSDGFSYILEAGEFGFKPGENYDPDTNNNELFNFIHALYPRAKVAWQHVRSDDTGYGAYENSVVYDPNDGYVHKLWEHFSSWSFSDGPDAERRMQFPLKIILPDIRLLDGLIAWSRVDYETGLNCRLRLLKRRLEERVIPGELPGDVQEYVNECFAEYDPDHPDERYTDVIVRHALKPDIDDESGLDDPLWELNLDGLDETGLQ